MKEVMIRRDEALYTLSLINLHATRASLAAYNTALNCYHAIEELLPIEVERKTGRWEYAITLKARMCSECGYFIRVNWDEDDERSEFLPNFCPHCGADMREGKHG